MEDEDILRIDRYNDPKKQPVTTVDHCREAFREIRKLHFINHLRRNGRCVKERPLRLLSMHLIIWKAILQREYGILLWN